MPEIVIEEAVEAVEEIYQEEPVVPVEVLVPEVIAAEPELPPEEIVEIVEIIEEEPEVPVAAIVEAFEEPELPPVVLDIIEEATIVEQEGEDECTCECCCNACDA